MRKLILALALTALAAASPAGGADLKFTGVFRWRGVTSENADLQSKTGKGVLADVGCAKACNDKLTTNDTRFRPRFTVTTEGGRVWGLIEYDIGNGNLAVAGDAGRRVSGSSSSITASENSERPQVTANRYVIDFLIPGTSLRARAGKTDYTNPGAWLVFGGEDNHSLEGMELYGPLFGGLHLKAFTTKKAEGSATEADDQDAYFVGVEWRPAPRVSVHPWVGFLNANVSAVERAAGLPDVESRWWGLTAGAKLAAFSVEFTGAYQRGTLDFKQGSLEAAGVVPAGLAPAGDVDIRAFAGQLNAEVILGPLTLGLQAVYATGDKDPLCGANCRSDISSTVRSQAGRVGHQQGVNANPDGTWSRFFSGKLDPTSLVPGGAYLIGPQLVSNTRYSTLSAGRSIREFGGDGEFANGLQIYELLVGWKILPDLQFNGNLSLIRSTEKRQDVLDGASGAVLTQFAADKDVGWEVDASLKWNLYKSLFARLTGSILFPGEFGKVTRLGSTSVPTKDQRDDPHWALLSEVRFTF